MQAVYLLESFQIRQINRQAVDIVSGGAKMPPSADRVSTKPEDS
jgi:hypothetical protein